MSVIFEVIFWVTVFMGSGGLMFCSVYALILFADLSVDHINPIEVCDYINRLVIPEYLGHVILSLIMLLRGYVSAALLNAPLILFHLRRYSERKHQLHSTSIFNDVEKERSVAQVKLAYHLIMFFVYIYYFIAMLVAD